VPRSSRDYNSSSKKILVYAMIGIISVAAVSVSVFARPPKAGTNEQGETLQEFQEQWCGPNAHANSSTYITEFVLPAECEMPVGIAVDRGEVWYVSTKRGLLGNYDSEENKFSAYDIPEWPSREQVFTSIPSWSMSWGVKIDGNGNVWFTDENDAIWRFNKISKSFDMFKVPASYPAAMDFDANGNIYFIGINSKSLYFGDVSKMKGGTSEGFREIALPLDGFSGIDLSLVSSGSLVVDNTRNEVWVSLLAFARKGQIFQYDIERNEIVRTVNLPADLSSPVGAALDNSGNLWVADHGTSTFFKYDPAQDSITKFVTSIVSPKIFGGTAPAKAYTLPYWVESGSDGSLWFNEHTGNKIARFDPKGLTLVEYWIPSQNRNWAFCPEGSSSCGLANVMQFAVGQDQVWFSEWTENKIAKLDIIKQVPITVHAPDETTVSRGDSTQIRVTLDASGDFSGKMMAAATFTPTGNLGNSSALFSQESISMSGGSKEVSYTFTPDKDLEVGQYVIMLGAGNDEVSLLKAIKVNIV
jgi:virginiamycin B lyase